MTRYLLCMIILTSCNLTGEKKLERDTVFVVQVPSTDTLKTSKNQNTPTDQKIIYAIDTAVAPQAEIEPIKNQYEPEKNKPDFVGKYDVRLTVTDSDCSSALPGDARIETWTIRYKDAEYFMTVKSDINTITEYTGSTAAGGIELEATHTTLLGNKSKATIRLWKDGTKIFGERTLNTIDKDGTPCRITQEISQ